MPLLTKHKVTMDKQTYAEFLNESEVFNDWLKQIPFNFDLCRLRVNDDNSVTMVFKNSLDTNRFKPMTPDTFAPVGKCNGLPLPNQ